MPTPMARNTVKMKHWFRTTWSVVREPFPEALPGLVIHLMCHTLLPAEDLIPRLRYRPWDANTCSDPKVLPSSSGYKIFHAMELILPELSMLSATGLVALSFFTSMLAAAVGIDDGLLMLKHILHNAAK
jgi:hypothetical protein